MNAHGCQYIELFCLKVFKKYTVKFVFLKPKSPPLLTFINDEKSGITNGLKIVPNYMQIKSAVNRRAFVSGLSVL
jgi:hypothetical protein